MSKTYRAEPSPLVAKLAKHAPKLRVHASVDEYGDGPEEDGEFRKAEKKRLMDKHKMLGKHLKNFDREKAADMAHESLKREHMKTKARLMEYADPDEMKEIMGGEEEPDEEAGEAKLEKEAYGGGGKSEAAMGKSKKKAKAPREDPYY